MLIIKNKQILSFISALSILGTVTTTATAATSPQSPNLFCYYDSQEQNAKGLAQYSLSDLEVGLQYCTHLIYGYVGLDAKTYQVISLNEVLDIQQGHFETVTALKEKFPKLKVLLSLGGDHDLEQPEKYLRLLEAGRVKQNIFIESARIFLKAYNFDGIDLALQLPRNKPRKAHTELGLAWKSFKKLFTGDAVVDPKANEHREQITNLIKNMRSAFQLDNLMLSLTVLPNVNASWYFDAPALMHNLDFVTLAAFDFVTPDRNPEEADYTAPLYEVSAGNRLPYLNVDFQVEHWLQQQRVPANKINLGVASYGRAWKMTKESGSTGMPIVEKTAGPAAAVVRSYELGRFNWQQVCGRLSNENINGMEHRGVFAPLHFESDPTKRYGVYAFRAADEHGEHGLWISYEDPETAGIKAQYAKNKHLGGIALFDLTNDDFRGLCRNHEKYPMLRSIKRQLS